MQKRSGKMKKKVITVMTALSLMVCTLCTNAVKASAYNGYNAAKYAKKYAITYNSDYDRWDSDCTNFVSQCLYYGGESMRKNSNVAKKKGGNIYSSKTHWFYCGDAQKYAVSTPWLRCSGTNNFLNFWTGKVSYSTYKDYASAQKNVKPGYVVQITDPNYIVYHSIICVAKENGVAYMASHTSNYAKKSFKNVYTSAVNSRGKGVKFLVYRF